MPPSNETNWEKIEWFFYELDANKVIIIITIIIQGVCIFLKIISNFFAILGKVNDFKGKINDFLIKKYLKECKNLLFDVLFPPPPPQKKIIIKSHCPH